MPRVMRNFSKRSDRFLANLKQMVGIKAAEYVNDGMIVGLGTGSTAWYLVEEIGRRVAEEGLKITGVTTSKETTAHAEQLNIPLKSIDEVPFVDVTIDGADEISADFQGIKGGGAALLFEKIVATYSKKVIWIVDSSKMVEHLGKFPLPVEVIPYGSVQLKNHLETLDLAPVLRVDDQGEIVKTDSNNYILDLHVEKIMDPEKLAATLSPLAGVVEHGLFLNKVNTVIVGYPEGPKVMEVR